MQKRDYTVFPDEPADLYIKEEDGESLKDGLSIKKPMRGPFDTVPGRVSSTDYYDPLQPEEK